MPYPLVGPPPQGNSHGRNGSSFPYFTTLAAHPSLTKRSINSLQYSSTPFIHFTGYLHDILSLIAALMYSSPNLFLLCPEHLGTYTTLHTFSHSTVHLLLYPYQTSTTHTCALLPTWSYHLYLWHSLVPLYICNCYVTLHVYIWWIWQRGSWCSFL